MVKTAENFIPPTLERVDCEIELVVSFADTGPEGTKVFTFRWPPGRTRVKKTLPVQK